jgi:hypothetical protein
MITKSQAQFYHDQGCLLIEKVLDSATVEAMRREADATIARMNEANLTTNRLWDGTWLTDKDRKKQRVDAVHDMQFQAGVFTELLVSKGFLDSMEMLIGPNVQLHHAKLLAKPPQTGDALAFNYLTVHGSGSNRSTRPRRNIFLQLRDPADPPTKEFHSSRGQGMMLRGINPFLFGAKWEDAQEELAKP